MVGFGFGTIIGSGVYDFTLVFAAASIVSSIVHKDAQVLDPMQVFPLLGLYIFYAAYVTLVSSLDTMTFYLPLPLLLLLPMSYRVFRFAASFGSDNPEDNDYLKEAWSKLDQLRKERQSILSESYSMENSTLSDLYQRNVDYFGSQIDYDRHKQLDIIKDRLNSSKTSSVDDILDTEFTKSFTEQYMTGEDEEETSFLFTPKPEIMKKKYRVQESPLLKSWKFVSMPWHFLFDRILPVDRRPKIAFVMIIAICFFVSDLQLSMADRVISRLHLNHNFVALTFYNWFSNITDLLTAISAAKKREFNLALTTIFSSQIINIQVALCAPWFIKAVIHGDYSFEKIDMTKSMLSIMLVLVVLASLLAINKMRLTYCLGVALICVYLGYISFQLHEIPKLL